MILFGAKGPPVQDEEEITMRIPGAAVKKAVIEIGETTTGEPGTDATVENTGTGTHAVLQFTIPRGDTGAQGEQGPQGIQGIQGEQGDPGTPGVGVPSGGTTGQVLTKNSGTDYDTKWADIPGKSFIVEEVNDISQANLAGADIKIGAAPSGGASIAVSSGWRASFLSNQVNYAANSAQDPLTLTVNLLNEAIPVGGTRRRFTEDTLWRGGGKCFAFDLGGRITAFTPGSGSAQGTNTKETGALKYLVGAQTGGYLLGGILTAGNGWLATWGEGAADISPFAITVTNVKFYKVVEV